MYGDLGCSLSGLLGCLRNHPVRTPHSSASAASRNSKGAYLRRCAHITPADKLASLFFLSPPPFPLPISPGLILLYFSCNLGEVLQGSSSNRPPPHASSTISGWVRERERLDMATISLSATLSRLDVAIHQLSFNIAHFACLAFLKLLHKWMFPSISFFLLVQNQLSVRQKSFIRRGFWRSSMIEIQSVYALKELTYSANVPYTCVMRKGNGSHKQ